MGYSPQGCKESDMTEETEHACTKFLELEDYIVILQFQKRRITKLL